MLRISLQVLHLKRGSVLMGRRLMTGTRTGIALALALWCIAAGAPTNETPQKRLRFGAPKAPWDLTLPADGLTVNERTVKPDGRSA
jgi:hypothetical protein